MKPNANANADANVKATKVAVKVTRLSSNDIRRLSLQVDATSFASLQTALAGAFAVSDFVIKYRDEEGDLVTVRHPRWISFIVSVFVSCSLFPFAAVCSTWPLFDHNSLDYLQ